MTFCSERDHRCKSAEEVEEVIAKCTCKFEQLRNSIRKSHCNESKLLNYEMLLQKELVQKINKLESLMVFRSTLLD